MTDTAELKARASEAFAKGKFSKAGELYRDYCKAAPKDLQSRLRMGDAWARAHHKDRAIDAYKEAAEGFAKDGFLPRAIAASKLILELDPAHQGVQQMLADLYARRGLGGSGGRAVKVTAAPVAVSTPRAIELPPEPIELPPEPEPLPADLSAEPILLTPKTPAEPLPREEEPEPKVHAIEIEEGSADELDFSSLSPEEPTAPAVEIEVEVEEDTGSIGASLETVSSEASELEISSAEVGVEISVDVGAAAPEPPKAVEAPPPKPAPAPRPSQSIPLDLDDAEVATEILGKLEAPRPVVPGPPPPPSRIVTSSHAAPPGLRRKAPEGEPSGAAVKPVPAAPVPERYDPSELRASFAAFSAFDELELGSFPASLSPEPSPIPRAVASPAAASPVAASPVVASVSPRPGVAAASEEKGPHLEAGGFTELELTGDSLLHAVELAAQQARPNVSEEEAFSAEEEPAEAAPEGELPRIPLFSDLPQEAFIALFERSPLRRLGMGERIITQGSVGDAFYVICEGAVRVVREDGGQTRELARLKHGSFFGEMALLSGAPRTASVESADEDTQLLEISAPVLAELSKEHPQIATALRKFCRQRMLSNVMESSALFRPFGKGDRRTLIEKFRAREVKPADVVIQEGQRGDGLYVVLSGEVEVLRQGQVLAQLKEGELFGEMSLLEKKPATASVRAVKRSSLLRLPREDFDALILSHPQILMLVSELTEDRRRRNQALGAPAVPKQPEGDEPLVLV